MGKPIAIAVAGGAASALLVLALTVVGWNGAVVVTLLTPLPLLVAGLSLGLPGAAIAAVSGALILTLALGGIAPGATLLLAYGVPAALIGRQALLNRRGADGRVEWYPPAGVLLWIVGYGLAGLLLALGLAAGREGGLEAAVAEHLTESAQAMPPGMSGAFRDAGVEQLARVVPGLAVVMWSLQMLVNLWLAQGLLGRFGGKVRPRFDIAEIDMPGWLAVALAAASVVAAAAPGLLGFLALNVALALGFCFFMAGLAVIHAAVRAKPFKPLALAAVYLSLLLSWPALLITGLGVVEQWAGFRRRALARNRED
jgi:hypothetical protein